MAWMFLGSRLVVLLCGLDVVRLETSSSVMWHGCC